MSFLYVEIQVTSTNLEPEKYVLRVIFKRYLNSKIVNLEYFNNQLLFLETKNKVTREIIQIAAEHGLLFKEYKIQIQTGEKKCLPT